MENVKPRHELEKIVADINARMKFGGMHLELSSDERFDRLVEFILGHFFPDDVLTNAVGLTVGREQIPVWKERYSDNLSLLLIDDATDDIIGANMIVLRHKDELNALPTSENEKVQKLIAFLHQADEGMDVFRYYDSEVVIHFRGLVIRKDYRRQGLASKLTKAASLYSKEIGLENPCLFVDATSINSQRIYEKLGFEILHTLYYDDFKVNGELVFKDTGDTKATVVYVKKL